METQLVAQLKTFIASLAAILVTITPAPQQSVQQNTPPNAPNVSTSSGTSRNWAGYSAENGQFTSVTGTWTVPSVTGNGHTAADAAWVGIGGVNNNDLIQSGVQNLVSPNGQTTTNAFYETLPDISQPIPVPVKSGDSVTVTITQQSNGQWQITFHNNTSGQNYQTNVSYNSSLTSAEWIEEAPSDGRSIIPLDNFGSVSFTGGSAVKNGNKQSLSDSQAGAVTMVNYQGQDLATASALGSDGAGFTVTRTSAVSNPGTGAFDNNPGGFRRRGFGIGGYAPYPGVRRQYYRVQPTITPDNDDQSQSSDDYQTPGNTQPQSGEYRQRKIFIRGWGMNGRHLWY